MLISDVCHNCQFKKVILNNVTHISSQKAVYLFKKLSYVKRYSACTLHK